MTAKSKDKDLARGIQKFAEDRFGFIPSYTACLEVARANLQKIGMESKAEQVARLARVHREQLEESL